VALAQLAARQHGVVATRNLAALGFPRSTITRHVAAGRLFRVFRGVYAVGHPRLSRRGRWMAAALAYGQNALVSHRSAAALWGLLPPADGRIDVTVDKGARRAGRAGVRLHRARLHPDDRSLRDAIPLTSPSRTLLDLADVARSSTVRRAFEEAERLRIFDLRALRALLRRSRGRRGLRVLGELLAEGSDLPPTVRSELEREFRDLIRSAGLPMPVANAVVAGIEVDALWPGQRLVVELDGYDYHRPRAAFERDRERDERLLLAGLRVVRFTAKRLRQHPVAIERTIRRMLEGG
jgi:predicted transcriptional regulator of viral defense system